MFMVLYTHFSLLFSEWLDTVYFPTNKERMLQAYELCRRRLEAMGVEVHPCKAAFFAYANFSEVRESDGCCIFSSA